MGQYASDYIFLLSYNDTGITRRNIAIVTIVFNFCKLIITGILCCYSLHFASQVQRVVEENVRVYGEDDFHVKSLKMTDWFITRLIIAYLIGDFFVCLVKPCLIVWISFGKLVDIDSYTWAKSIYLIIESFYLFEVNI